jgi:hypothetical protein
LIPALQETEVRPISALAPGVVQIEGRTRAVNLVREPRQGQEVLGYRLLVDEQQPLGDWGMFTPRIWRLVFDVSEVSDFVLEDDTGSVRVDASGALPLVGYTLHQGPRAYDLLSQQLIDFWERHGLTTTALAKADKLRVLECLLQPETHLFVFGYARASDRSVPGSGTYRDAPQPELVVGPFPSRGAIVADRRRTELLKYITDKRGRLLLPRASYVPGI